MNLNDLSKAVHAANIKWWRDIDTGLPIERNRCELIALVISELSEALEGERKNMMDEHLPHRKSAEVEMADAKIRLLDYSAGFGLFLIDHEYHEEMPTNKGEAIFTIMKAAAKIPDSPDGPYGAIWINYTLSLINSYCEMHDYDLQGALEEKMAYNKGRSDHSHAARRIAGGKQF